MTMPETSVLSRLAGGICVTAAHGTLYGYTKAEVEAFVKSQLDILHLVGYTNVAIADYINDLVHRMNEARLGTGATAVIKDGKIVINGVAY